MIPVSIVEDIVLSKALKNDKGTLVLGMKVVTGNLLDSLNSSTDDSASGGLENDFLFFPLQATNFDKAIDTAANNTVKIQELKDQLTHILLRFMTSDKITWDILKGTGITPDNIDVKVIQQTTLDVIYANIVEQFLSMVKPFVNNTSQKSRVLLTRKSKAQHFPALRKRYLTDQPFIESMSVPKEASALKYTEWEIKNGYNNPNKIETAAADATDPAAADIAKSVFATV